MVLILPIAPITMPSSLDGHHNGQLPPELLISVNAPGGGAVLRLVEYASWAFEAMLRDSAGAGFRLMATSAADSYRSYDQQASTFIDRHYRVAYKTDQWWDGSYWELKPSKAPSAVPGESNHGWGLAVDLAEQRDADAAPEDLSDEALEWLAANAARFGISAELQVEPWHWRYHNGDQVPAAVLLYLISKGGTMRFTFAADLGTPPELVGRVHIGGGERYRIVGKASKVDALHAKAGAGPLINVTKADLYPDWDYKRAVRELLGTLDPGEYTGPDEGDGTPAPPADVTAVAKAAYDGAAAGAKAQLARATSTTTVTYQA